MSKPLAIFLTFVLFVAGVLLGNQYGRRDVINSRPPEITGAVISEDQSFIVEDQEDNEEDGGEYETEDSQQ